MCVCNLWYPVYSAHEPYFHMWPLHVYDIFPLYIINGRIIGKRLNIKCVFLFSILIFSETFLFLRRIERNIINVQTGSYKVPVEFSRQIFEEYSNIRFYENPSHGSRDIPCWRTDGQTHTTKVIDAFRNCMYAPVRASLILPNWAKLSNVRETWDSHIDVSGIQDAWDVVSIGS
jgi:hypothetical protein